MQIFIVGDLFETAQALDSRRLNKQIIECRQILSALNGDSKFWRNHPCTLQYKEHIQWLRTYMWFLEEWREKRSNLIMLIEYNLYCKTNKPLFHTQEYFNQMKRRLYTKDNEYYKQWAELGESNVNWYYVDNEWRYYENGKRVKYNK